MTKEITKAIILQQIQDKFKLRELEPARFTFSEEVVPTYNIESHLGDWIVKEETVSITSAASYVFFTVPQNERWLLRAYQPIFMTGTYTISGVFLNKRPPPTSSYIYLDLKLGQSVSYLVNLPTITVAQPGNEIKVMVDGHTAVGNLRLLIDMLVEEIR